MCHVMNGSFGHPIICILVAYLATWLSEATTSFLVAQSQSITPPSSPVKITISPSILFERALGVLLLMN